LSRSAWGLPRVRSSTVLGEDANALDATRALLTNQSTTPCLARSRKTLTGKAIGGSAENTSPVPGVAFGILFEVTFDGAIGVLFGCPIG
jgi:hypothetical protein